MVKDICFFLKENGLSCLKKFLRFFLTFFLVNEVFTAYNRTISVIRAHETKDRFIHLRSAEQIKDGCMGKGKISGFFRRCGTGSAGRGILTVLFVCVISGFCLAGCGPQWEADFFLEQEEGEGGSGTLPGNGTAAVGSQSDAPGERDTVASAGRDTGRGPDIGMGVGSGAEADSFREEPENVIYVHVCGAVNSPGLKKLPEGSRAFDALEMAEGFTEDADADAVNLAALLTDGQQLYFPAEGESADPGSGMGGSTGKVNLNTANVKELCTLKGIGESRAEAILKYREEKGGFSNVEELMQVPGIKESIFQKICDQVTVK